MDEKTGKTLKTPGKEQANEEDATELGRGLQLYHDHSVRLKLVLNNQIKFLI